MSNSNSSSRHRSLFRDSYENQNKREGMALQKMDEATSEYLMTMEEDSPFFGTAGDPFGSTREEAKGSRNESRNSYETCGGVVVPRFEPNEIELQTTIGMGEFGMVLNVLRVCLDPRIDDNDEGGETETSYAKNENCASDEMAIAVPSEPSVLWLPSAKQNHIHQVEANRILRERLASNGRGRRTNGSFGKVSVRDVSAKSFLVIKQIRKDLYPNKRIEAAKELAREAKFLARLQQLYSCSEGNKKIRMDHRNNHPNLITLRGIVSNSGSPEFGILLDRLHLTLEELSNSWGNYQEKLLERHSGHHSQKRGIVLPLKVTQWWKASDQVVGAALGKITNKVEGFFHSGEDDRGDASVVKESSESASPEALLLLTERVLALWDVAEGMGHLHSHRILLRDLKPENVGRNTRFVGGAGGQQPQQRMQIFDFGLAKECKTRDRIGPSRDENGFRGYGDDSKADETGRSSSSSSFYDHYKMSGLTGTRRIMAPEVIRCKPYGLPADVYSFGICLWEVFSGTKCSYLSPAKICEKQPWIRPEPPLVFDDDDDDDFADGTKSYKSSCLGMPRTLQKLMERCWHEDPRRRPSYPDISVVLRSVLAELARQMKTIAPTPGQQQPKSPDEHGDSHNNPGVSSIFSKAASGGGTYLLSPWRTCVNGNGDHDDGGGGVGKSFLTTMVERTFKRRQQHQHQPVDAGGFDGARGVPLDQTEVWNRLESLRASSLLDD